MEAVSPLVSCLLLPFEKIGELDDPFTKSRQLAGLMYACPMAYFVGTKLGGRPRPLRGIDPSLVPDPRTRITVT